MNTPPPKCKHTATLQKVYKQLLTQLTKNTAGWIEEYYQLDGPADSVNTQQHDEAPKLTITNFDELVRVIGELPNIFYRCHIVKGDLNASSVTYRWSPLNGAFKDFCATNLFGTPVLYFASEPISATEINAWIRTQVGEHELLALTAQGDNQCGQS